MTMYSSSFVFNKDTGNAEDTYQMFWSSMNAEIAPIRYILGPNASAPEEDTTYQHLDWVANLQYYYDNLLKEDENNHRSVLEILHDLSFTVTRNDLGNGYKEYKAVPKFSDGTSFDPMADSTLPSGETFFEILNKEKDESGKTYADVETVLHWTAD